MIEMLLLILLSVRLLAFDVRTYMQENRSPDSPPKLRVNMYV